MSGDKPQNPWGRPSNNDDKRTAGRGGSGGNRGGGNNGGEPPDLDDMIRKAQQNFSGLGTGAAGGGKFIGLAFLAIVSLWFASGFYIVNPGEFAVIQRFGAWDRTQADPGLGYHFPTPIETSDVINVQEIRKMTIGFVDVGNRGGTSSRRSIAEESLMLTSDRNIVDLHLVIQWNIKSAEDYLFQIRDQENTIKKVAESAIREVVGQTDMFPIITRDRQIVAERTKTIIQENLDAYKSGVYITQILIDRAEVHPDVQDAFQDVQSAKQDGEDVQNRAEAYREDILPKARGYAKQLAQEAQAYKQSVVAKSNGDAQRFDQVYTAYLSGKAVTKERIYIETMENVLKNASKIILDNGGSNQGVVPYLPLNELSRKTGAQ